MPDQPDDITRLRKASYALEDLPETIAFSPADDNEADAIALLLWAIETNGGVA